MLPTAFVSILFPIKGLTILEVFYVCRVGLKNESNKFYLKLSRNEKSVLDSDLNGTFKGKHNKPEYLHEHIVFRNEVNT